MEFTDDFEKLRADISETADVVSQTTGLRIEMVERLMIHGIFIAAAHCREVHGVELPIDPTMLLSGAVGEEKAREIMAEATSDLQENPIKKKRVLSFTVHDGGRQSGEGDTP